MGAVDRCHRTLARAALAIWLFVPFALPARKTVHSATDEQVRAAFFYQLAQFVTWPEQKDRAPIQFCVLGNDGFADMLDAVLKGKTIREHALTVRKAANLDQFSGCHIAFLALGKRKQLQDALARWGYTQMLLVGEAEGFTEMGGMVNLKIDDGRVSIEINLNAARKAGLDIRSQLLQVARIVPGVKP